MLTPSSDRPALGAFVRPHAQALVACDCCVVGTARCRILYVFVALEVGSRRLLHGSAPAPPIAVGTPPQLRESLAAPHGSRFVLPERDRLDSPGLAAARTALGVRVLGTPGHAPAATADCERLLGTRRRECVGFLIPFGEKHLRRVLRIWQDHYHRWRTHLSLAMDCSDTRPVLPPDQGPVIAVPEVGGLHHHYQRAAA